MSTNVIHYAQITNFRGQTLVKQQSVCGKWAPDESSLSRIAVTCPECLAHIERHGESPIKYPERLYRVYSGELA